LAVPAPDPRRWLALAVVGTAFFMTILDVSIVNVALPTIGEKLHFSRGNLQWVVTAYAITFGGFLLLSGRCADLLGRRRVFIAGVTLFSLASLVCGLATNEATLISARAVQGVGGAIISASALSIVSTTFIEGAERNKALGIWGALGGSGAAVGVLAGGVLTKYLGWEWIFFVNVPVGALVLAATRPIVHESRIETEDRSFDPLGAITVTGGVALFVYTLSRAPFVGWGSTRTIVFLLASVALIAAFLVNESRVRKPLMPFEFFRVRTVAGANVVGLMLGGVVFANFFVLTLYVQDVLHYSALKAGVTFLATAGTAVFAAGAAQALVTRVGVKPILALGLAMMTAAMIWYTRIPVNGSYVKDLLPGYILVGVGIAFAFVPVTIAALAGVDEREAGLGSGLINTSQQIGGGIGVALASTVFNSHIGSATQVTLKTLTDGYALSFWVLAAFGIAGFIATLALISDEEIGEPATAPAAAEN
jgi:EmrB/QacA subfamily drug resistance transporter